MSKTYSFEFSGTRDDFMATLRQYPNNNHKYYYFNDYIVKIEGNIISFGVERGGHSGGYWFKPTIIESDDGLLFTGTIEYIDPYTKDKDSVFYKFVHTCEYVLVFLFLLPYLIIFHLYRSIKNLIMKIRKQPIVKEVTEEDRLFDLMENRLHCKRIQKS